MSGRTGRPVAISGGSGFIGPPLPLEELDKAGGVNG
jgi:hypothetical protein